MPKVPGVPATRSAYLLDGRRVTVSDLVTGGMLAAGTALKFKRPRINWKTARSSCRRPGQLR